MDGLYYVAAASALVIAGYFAYIIAVEKKVRDLEKRL